LNLSACGSAVNRSFDLICPPICTLPLVVDSPHSWPNWPKETPCVASQADLASGCDAYVDELWNHALDGRAALLSARFHRSFIDANRARDDIDPDMLDGAWPLPLDTSDKSRRGFGLIRRLALPGVPVYDRRLSVEEVRDRIVTCYDPYHGRLASVIGQTHATHGRCIHLDCHSMKSVGNAMNEDNGKPRPDMVVSDLDGASASPYWTQLVTRLLRAQGYEVQVNDPYKGAEIIRRHGQPTQGRHSVQIEINRSLYMNEKTRQKLVGFSTLASNLRRFISELAFILNTRPHDICP
jgi:N-formylglutamate deformylase